MLFVLGMFATQEPNGGEGQCSTTEMEIRFETKAEEGARAVNV